jgi:hypothetical protein
MLGKFTLMVLMIRTYGHLVDKSWQGAVKLLDGSNNLGLLSSPVSGLANNDGNVRVGIYIGLSKSKNDDRTLTALPGRFIKITQVPTFDVVR